MDVLNWVAAEWRASRMKHRTAGRSLRKGERAIMYCHADSDIEHEFGCLRLHTANPDGGPMAFRPLMVLVREHWLE